MYFFDFETPLEDRMIHVNDHNDKLVYIVVFEEGQFLNEKVRRICGTAAENMFELRRE